MAQATNSGRVNCCQEERCPSESAVRQYVADGCMGGDGIHLSEDRVQCWALEIHAWMYGCRRQSVSHVHMWNTWRTIIRLGMTKHAMYVRTYHWGTFVKPLLPWKTNKYYVFCVCVALLSQHGMRIRHLWPLRLYHIFPPHLTNGIILGKKVVITYVFWLSVQHLSETFLVLRIIQRDTVINLHGL